MEKTYPIKVTLTDKSEVICFVESKMCYFPDDIKYFPDFKLSCCTLALDVGCSLAGNVFINTYYDLEIPPNIIINGRHIVKVELYTEFDKLRTILEGRQTNEDWIKEKINLSTEYIQSKEEIND